MVENKLSITEQKVFNFLMDSGIFILSRCPYYTRTYLRKGDSITVASRIGHMLSFSETGKYVYYDNSYHSYKWGHRVPSNNASLAWSVINNPYYISGLSEYHEYLKHYANVLSTEDHSDSSLSPDPPPVLSDKLIAKIRARVFTEYPSFVKAEIKPFLCAEGIDFNQFKLYVNNAYSEAT